MKTKDLILPFKNWFHYILATLVFSILLNIVFWQDSFNEPKTFALAMLWSATIWVTQWLGNVYIGTKIGEKYSWLHHSKKRVIYGIIGIVIYSSVAFVLVQFLMNYLVFGTVPSEHLSWISTQLKITIPLSLSLSFIFNSIGFFQNWRKSELNAQKLETEMLRYKYESLQNQINPHFLFNSFNVLTELITEDQNLAVKFVQQMSGLYRYVLESKEKELVKLFEEREFIEKFVFMLETRFENKVNFVIAIENKNNYFIVPMALQLLIENAVKHNVATTNKPLTVLVKQKGDTIIVSNSLQLKSSNEHSTKTGLENLKQQYAFFTEREILISENEKAFVVVIPLLETFNHKKHK